LNTKTNCPTIAMNAGEFETDETTGPPWPLAPAPVSPRKLDPRQREILLLGS
jgi:hypothetical protein